MMMIRASMNANYVICLLLILVLFRLLSTADLSDRHFDSVFFFSFFLFHRQNEQIEISLGSTIPLFFTDWMAFSHIINTFPYHSPPPPPPPPTSTSAYIFTIHKCVFHVQIRIRKMRKTYIQIFASERERERKKSNIQLYVDAAVAVAECLLVLTSFCQLYAVYCFHFSIDVVMGLTERLAKWAREDSDCQIALYRRYNGSDRESEWSQRKTD